LKKTFLMAAVAAVALALPALAQAQTGYVDFGYRDIEDTDGFSVGGAAATEVGGVQLQFNANHVRQDVAGFDVSATDLVAHAFTQNDSYAVGGFVSATDLVGTGIYGIGGEGSLYFGDLTLNGVVSYNTVDNGGGHFYNYGVGARYFVTENFSAGVSYDTVDFSNGGGDIDVWGLETEYKFSNPVSVYASYANIDLGGVDGDKFSVGIRYNFGGDTLKAQERSGAKAMRAVSATALSLF